MKYSASLALHNREMNLFGTSTQEDLDDFNQQVLRYQDIAYQHANILMGDPYLAEDVVQESFIKAFQNMGRFRGGSFRAWLLRIVTNTAFDFLRQAKRRPSLPLFPEEEDGEEIESPSWLEDPSTPVQETVEQKEESRHLYRMLNELPELYRSVITLVDLYELDYVEAAEVLKVPVGTIKSRLARARVQVKSKLARSMGHSRQMNGFNAMARVN